MKTISIIITDITGKGGIERTTGLLCELFNNKGYKTRIISLFKSYKVPYVKIPLETQITYITEKNYTLPLSLFRRFILLLKCFLYLIKERQIFRGNIIICQAFLPAFMIYLSGMSSHAIVCEHFLYNMYNPFVTKVRNYIYSKFKSIITLTDNDKKKYSHVGLTAYTIPNICPFPIIQHEGSNSKNIISIGRLHKQKGYDLLLHAMVKVVLKYPDWKLNIYGEGKEKTNLMNLSNELGIRNNINFNGFSTSVSDVLNKSAIYVMSSRYEGFPMVLLEAMACGCPIVSFNCPEGPSDILKDGGGIIVPYLDSNKLSESIIYLIEHPELRKKFTQQAHESISKYSPEKIYNLWDRLFSKLYNSH